MLLVAVVERGVKIKSFAFALLLLRFDFVFVPLARAHPRTVAKPLPCLDFFSVKL